MKVEHFKNGSITTYNDNETFFIATLNEVAQRNIHRGLATPYDYGYKPECTYFKIDGQQIAGTQLSRDEFVKKFHELDNMLMDDTKNYYVLYEEENAFPWSVGQYKEIFWCISTSEIEFIRVGGEWHYLKDECADAIDKIVGRITLDEEEDEKLIHVYEEDEYPNILNKYNMFKDYLEHYILHCPDADESVFRFYKNMQNWVNSPDDIEICNDNRVCFILWLEKNWYAFMQSILDREYKYMNFTQIVWESWE